ncbi:general amino acid permease 1 [Leucogyrophana mollusca]|uniref:General amino acid permease 1 n=1 Tax=Leucogyrophana mollusca TaxID=85980 RepID=A0ACB8BAF5_9AGAM|nr:general amino acid permease 1 [Leucogyrophana mollusca]
MSSTDHDIEKSQDGGSVEVYPISDENNRFDVASIDLVQRRLKQRHVQMIAIAGTLGTGLFLGSGQALSGAGPLGALIAYALVGTVAYSSLCSIGEMTSHAPISGTFPHFAARWVDPALGFAVGWNYFYTNVITVPVEVSGAQILITYWDSNPNHAGIYIAVICIGVSAINIFGVRYFGEAEFLFSLIKLSMITGLILLGVIIDAEPGNGPGGGRLGFHYWNDPGVFNGAGLEPSHIGLDRFLGILSVLVQAAFSFQGMEIVAIAASETENPRRNIAKAVRRVFYRICIFYILGIFITGLLVPYNDPNLLQTAGTAADSPYVIAMTRAVLPGIINAGIMTSAFSASNSFLFCSSRILYGLALRGQAPRIFAYCTRKGLPIVAILFSAAFSFLSLMSISNGAETVFTWFVNLSTVGGFFSWGTINLTYLFFYRGMKAQGIDRKELHYWSGLQPYLSIWGFTWCSILILINGFEVFWNFTAAKFLTAYINIPLFFILYAFWKITKKTKVWDPSKMDFYTGIPPPEETESPEVPPHNFAEKVAAVLF